MILKHEASSVPFFPRHFIVKDIAQATSLDELNLRLSKYIMRLNFYSAKAMAAD